MLHPNVTIINEQQLITLHCTGCGKKRPYRLDRVEVGRFVHQCVICGSEHATHVEVGGLRREGGAEKRPLTPFEKLHWILMRDFTAYQVINTNDPRFFKIRYLVDGVDEYEVEYMDYEPVEIIHRFKRMTQGHTCYPWLNGDKQ